MSEFINAEDPLAIEVADEIRAIVASGDGDLWISPQAEDGYCWVSELDFDPEPPAARRCGYMWRYMTAADWLAEYSAAL